MKFLNFAIAVMATLALLTPTDGYAQPGPNNVVGLYLNADGTGATETFEVGVPVSVYLVLTNPTDVNNNDAPVTDLSAFECQLNFSGGTLFKLADSLPPSAINVGDNSDINQGFLEYIVGMGTPHPVTAGSVVLVSFQFLAISSDETIVTLGPTSTSGIPGEMTYYGDPGQPRTMYSAGGSHAAPVFRFNPVAPTPIDDIQVYDAIAGTPMSPYDTQVVTVAGTVYAVKGTLTEGGFYLQDETGGINYYAPDAEGIAIGDQISVTATVTNWGGEVYLHGDPLPDFVITGTGPEPDPRYFTVSDLVTDYENVGWFVEVAGTISGLTADGFVLTQGLDSVPVFISPFAGIDLSGYQDGDQVTVQGACVIRNGEMQVWPRYQTDLVAVTGPRIFYVAKTGSDETGDGSEGNPFATIQHAIDRTIDLDEVWVLPETYTGDGNRDIDFLGKAITVKSRDEDPATCIIDAEGTVSEPHRGFVFRYNEGPGTILRGFTVTNGYADTDNGGYYSVDGGGGILLAGSDPTEPPYVNDGASPTIELCIITNNVGGGVTVRGDAAAPSFSYCQFTSNVGAGLSNPWGYGTYTHCEFSNNTSYGLYKVDSKESIMDFSYCDFLQNENSGVSGNLDLSNFTFYQCRFQGNQGYGIGVYSSEVGKLVLRESVVSNNLSAGINTSSGFGAWLDLGLYDSQIFENGGQGLRLGDPEFSYIEIDSCRITDNENWGIEISPSQAKSLKTMQDPVPYTVSIKNSEIARNESGGIRGSVYLDDDLFHRPVLIERTLVNDNYGNGIELSLYSSHSLPRATLQLEYVTVVGNDGMGVTANADSLLIQNVLIANNGLEAVGLGTVGFVSVACSDFYGNAGGDWTGDLADLLDEPGNISVDPLFCGDGNGTATYTLMEISPCAAANSACGRIGALGVDCQALPVIESIVDVGNDQGRKVRLSWFASDYDQAGSIRPITEYGIYRRIDGYKNAAEIPRAGEKFAGWDFIERVPARADSFYQFVAPTLCDSTISGGLCLSTFIVSGMTSSPAIYYDSLPDSGYSVDNLSPAVPEGLIVAYSSEQNVLTWAPSAETDFSHYLVYRNLNAVDPLARATAFYAKVFATTMTDSVFGPGHDAWDYDYTLVAVDFAGNASALADPSGVSDVDDGVLPTQLSLGAAYPNPFNPMTTIVYEVPTMMPVSIRIFDVAGRLVRILVDGEAVPAGRHEAVWSGVDERGNHVAAGVYFYHLEAGAFTATKRMTLVK